jgi:hypothetical protein
METPSSRSTNRVIRRLSASLGIRRAMEARTTHEDDKRETDKDERCGPISSETKSAQGICRPRASPIHISENWMTTLMSPGLLPRACL